MTMKLFDTRTLLFTTAVGFLCAGGTVHAQSTSIDTVVTTPGTTDESQDEPREAITFSEFPLGTAISNQYQPSKGITFGGSGPFISGDGANPTSPVLSGTPRFQGNIEGTFVDPATGDPTIVESFTMDAGFFDVVGTTRLEWFDLEGRKLGQRSNSQFGIETFNITGGGISSWAFGIVETEPAGFAIDNVISTPVGASVVFREKSGDDKDGTWGLLVDEIPGFDHVGLQVEDIVYESHPGYTPGTYRSADGSETKAILSDDGVQGQHTLETFKFSSTTDSSSVIDLSEIPVDQAVAEQMRSAIQGVEASTFQRINFSNLEGIQETLLPAAQKGGDDSFTCVGLVEWASEQAGVNGGQGYIPNNLESFTVPTGVSFNFPNLELETAEIPTLSPELLYWSMTGQEVLNNIKQWVQGLFDPVDVIITDPLGRRIGYSATEGELNEIPLAFYSGDGGVEQFLVPNPIPGNYLVRLEGQGEQVLAATASDQAATGFSGFMDIGNVVHNDLEVEVREGTTGDVDRNGAIDLADLEAQALQLGSFTEVLGDPADLNGDGLVDQIDVELLQQLIDQLNPIAQDSCGLTKILPSNSWRMISLPQIAQGARTSVGAILGDDINAVYGEKWAVFAYTPDTTGYTQLSVDDQMQSGAGYWVIQVTGEDVELDMPPGSKMSASETDLPVCDTDTGCVVHNLRNSLDDEYDMVGNPYCQTLPIGELRIATTAGECADPAACALADVAGTEPGDIVANQFWTWNGSGYDESDASGIMAAWTGYWLVTMGGNSELDPDLVFLP